MKGKNSGSALNSYALLPRISVSVSVLLSGCFLSFPPNICLPFDPSWSWAAGQFLHCNCEKLDSHRRLSLLWNDRWRCRNTRIRFTPKILGSLCNPIVWNQTLTSWSETWCSTCWEQARGKQQNKLRGKWGAGTNAASSDQSANLFPCLSVDYMHTQSSVKTD